MILQPLRGIRILDFTTVPPGAYCTALLADLGAEVVKVEALRLKGQKSLLHDKVSLSKGKRSIAIDLKHPSAAGLIGKLAAISDVVLENANPGTMASRKIGYDDLKVFNPRLIWCSITSFGQDGPYSAQPGHDLAFMAHSGMLNALGGEPPWHPSMIIAVPFGGLMAANAIQSALIERSNSGIGAQIDISLSETATWVVAGATPDLAAPFEYIRPAPDRRVYQCSDGEFVAVTAAEPRTWRALCEALGLPELLGTLHVPAEADRVTAKLAEVFKTKPANEWVERLAPLGAAVIAVNRDAQIVDDPHIVARGSLTEIDGAKIARSPIRMSSADGRRSGSATSSPGIVGEYTVDLFKVAGLSNAEIDELLEKAVI